PSQSRILPMTQIQCALLFGPLLCVSLALAQTTTLPAPSRTVYKCTENGKVVYTDDPCIGAKRVDVEPTRGLNKSSGRELTGQDVSRERQREQLAEAVKPLTGLNPQQFEIKRSRIYLAPEVKTECARLDESIAQSEVQERAEPMETRPAIQRQLFALRKRHRDLRC
ncbi:MAG: DUF4124 domain-containing protein, partial [bacterium]